jgi:excinuclease UvrABC ATPase subunit
MQTIQVRGARAHNPHDIDVDIPRDSLTVITGLSGPGKSSLAFDTIYAEVCLSGTESWNPTRVSGFFTRSRNRNFSATH